MIKIKSNDNKRFIWYHIKHLNPLKMNPEKLVNDFDYNGIDFPVSKKIIARLNKKNKIFIHVFCYEFKLTSPVYVSNEKCKNCKNLLTITKINKSRYVYIKDFNRFMCSKTNKRNKKHFWKYYLQCFSNENSLATT